MTPEQNVEPNFYEPDISDQYNYENQEVPEEIIEEEENQPLQSDTNFNANLAEDIEEKDLQDLAFQLIEDIKNDKEARADWENSINLAFRYLGYRIEESRQEPFINACAAFDVTLSKALITSYAVFRAELFPSDGPCAAKVIGIETKETRDIAERVELFTNNYLTKVDRGYYPDSEQLIIYTIFCGSAFRKVYPDPMTGKPIARMIKPQNFIVNPDTVDLMSATRMTHVLEYTRKEVLDLERSGFYKEGSLPEKDSNEDDDEDMSSINKTIDKMDGIDKDAAEHKMVVRYYECHVELDPTEVEMGIFKPADDAEESYKPYIVTICAESKKIAAIRRGWEENSPDFKKETYFINYYYIKGFGIYGLGLAHLMGSNSIVLTSTLRQLIDAATLKNFPAFLIAKGTRLEDNNIALGPGEGKQVDTAGQPIQSIIMPLPYGEPSAALMQLRNELIEQSSGVGVVTQAEIPEAGINAPVGTTLALLEVANRVQSTVLRSFHFSLSYEFELIYNLLGKYLPDQPYPFAVPGKEVAVMKSDFSDRINITPVSNPNSLMKTHRILLADMQMKVADSHPDLHNMREVIRRVYMSAGIENIDEILPPAPVAKALDAVTENMNVMIGQPITASLEQDHDSHLLIHPTMYSQLLQLNNIAAYVTLMTHVQVHKALRLIQQSPELQQMLMPGAEEWNKDPHILLTIPQVQNQIDSMDAQEEFQKQQQAAEQAASQPVPMDPTQVMADEVQQKREATQIDFEKTKMRMETDLEIAKMKHEEELAKMALQKELAEDKHKMTLLVEQMKLEDKKIKELGINNVNF